MIEFKGSQDFESMKGEAEKANAVNKYCLECW